MTIQCNDTCFHEKIQYEILDLSGSDFFNPHSIVQDFGIASTGCYRGYKARFSVVAGDLFLTSIVTGSSIKTLSGERVKVTVDEGPVLFGTLPSRCSTCAIYENFRYPIPFTGGLILGDSNLWPLAMRVGFDSAWEGYPLREISFVKGRVTHENDLTSEWEYIDYKITAAMCEAKGAEKQEVNEQVKEWVCEALVHKYRW